MGKGWERSRPLFVGRLHLADNITNMAGTGSIGAGARAMGQMTLSNAERQACTEAKQAAIKGREVAATAMAAANSSGSQRRPALYQRAIAAFNQANELLEQARSANGR